MKKILLAIVLILSFSMSAFAAKLPNVFEMTEKTAYSAAYKTEYFNQTIAKNELKYLKSKVPSLKNKKINLIFVNKKTLNGACTTVSEQNNIYLFASQNYAKQPWLQNSAVAGAAGAIKFKNLTNKQIKGFKKITNYKSSNIRLIDYFTDVFRMAFGSKLAKKEATFVKVNSTELAWMVKNFGGK